MPVGQIVAKSRNKGKKNGMYGKCGPLNPFYGKHHTPETRKILSEKASRPKPYLRGEKNGMYYRRGKLNPNWARGATPERQALYDTQEWKDVVDEIRERDRGHCARCGRCRRKRHIHHIIPFADIAHRTDINNLITLCCSCHRFVHSKGNKDREFLKGGDANASRVA